MIKTAIRQAVIFVITGVVLGALANTFRPNGIDWLRPDIPVLAENQDSSVTADETPGLAAITLAQAKEFYARGIPFIDAREWDYYAEGHIAGAYNADNYMALVFTLDSLQGRDQPIVTYCDGDECGSSEELAYDLQASGFTNIYIFLGGWSEWKNAGMPIAP
ncbi:MAG: rhodanese-like domain-containing protein [Fidelibacterota bacterium]